MIALPRLPLVNTAWTGQSPMAEESLLLDIGGVARLLSVSTTTVRQLVESGELPRGRKLGTRAVRWLRSEIEDYVQSLKWQKVEEKDENLDCAKTRQGAPSESNPKRPKN